MERIDQEDTSGQAPQPEHESPPSPTPVAAQPAATQRRRKRPLATRKGILLCTLAVLVIGAGVIVGALKLQTPSGRVKWTHYIGNLWDGSPTVSNGIVYIGNQENTIYALNAASGQVIWSIQLGHYTDFNDYTDTGITPTPVVSNGIVYANSQDCSLYALDARTGRTIWSSQAAHCDRAAPVVANGMVYAGSENGGLYALDAVSGRERWSYQPGPPDYLDFMNTAPVVEQGVIYIASNDGAVALDAVSGQEKWKGFVAGESKYTPVIANGLVYVTTLDGELDVLDATSGQEKWSFFSSHCCGIASSPIVVGKSIYLYSLGGIMMVDTSTHQERWFHQLSVGGTFTTPVIVQNTIYVIAVDRNWLRPQNSLDLPDKD
ncbi:MAG TPA: PQQ-binding-like beta-propeller repeat protein, partial [Ktedonobacterales bacterium]